MTDHERYHMDREGGGFGHMPHPSELPSLDAILLGFEALAEDSADRVELHMRADVLLTLLVRRLGYTRIADLYEQYAERFYYS